MPLITLPEPKYPLTESEKKWLKSRQRLAIKSCRYCDYYSCESPCADWYDGECVFDFIDTSYYYKDTAEFEARVAAKVAAMHWDCVGCPGDYVDDCSITDVSCTETRLKHARIEVEEEMEGENVRR